MERRIEWGRLSCLPCAEFQPTYFEGAQGGGTFSGVSMLGGNSFCVDDCLGWRIHMGMLFTNTFQIPCLKGSSRQHLIAFLSTLLIHDDSYLANLPAWERQYGDSLLTQHLIIWRRSSYVDSKVGGGDILQLYPCSFLRTRNIWEGRTVIF